jgi:hypothetical protein
VALARIFLTVLPFYPVSIIPPVFHTHSLMSPNLHDFQFIVSLINTSPISVAAKSKKWVYGRSFAGIAGSNPVSVMDVRLL